MDSAACGSTPCLAIHATRRILRCSIPIYMTFVVLRCIRAILLYVCFRTLYQLAEISTFTRRGDPLPGFLDLPAKTQYYRYILKSDFMMGTREFIEFSVGVGVRIRPTENELVIIPLNESVFLSLYNIA